VLADALRCTVLGSTSEEHTNLVVETPSLRQPHTTMSTTDGDPAVIEVIVVSDDGVDGRRIVRDHQDGTAQLIHRDGDDPVDWTTYVRITRHALAAEIGAGDGRAGHPAGHLAYPERVTHWPAGPPVGRIQGSATGRTSMRIAYGYVISDREYGVEQASDRLLDVVRDEQGVPRDEWNPDDPDAVLAAAGLHVGDGGDGDDDGEWEPFVLSTPPADVDIPGGDLDTVPAPADTVRLAWALKALDLPAGAHVEEPRWLHLTVYGVD
jgi:hypothetical protein